MAWRSAERVINLNSISFQYMYVNETTYGDGTKSNSLFYNPHSSPPLLTSTRPILCRNLCCQMAYNWISVLLMMPVVVVVRSSLCHANDNRSKSIYLSHEKNAAVTPTIIITSNQFETFSRVESTPVVYILDRRIQSFAWHLRFFVQRHTFGSISYWKSVSIRILLLGDCVWYCSGRS